MKLLFIGGTGLISSACAELAIERGHELTLLNRGTSQKYLPPAAAKVIPADIRAVQPALTEVLQGERFDAVVDFIAFTEADVERDIRLFNGRTAQYVFISSAAAYHKPPNSYLVTEDTTLANPYWQYARDKIACEQRLMMEYEARGFPVTIVRPSLTYGPMQIPFCVGSWAHPWTIIDRMKRGKEIVVPGDGTSLWVLTWNADFAIGLIGLLGKPGAIGQAVQITSDEVLTWNQIYGEAFNAFEMEPNIIHVPADVIAAYWSHAQGSLLGDKIHSVVFDNSKIKRLVPEFQCRVSWPEGLRRALAWHKEHPEFQTIDREFDETMDRIVAGQRRSLPLK